MANVVTTKEPSHPVAQADESVEADGDRDGSLVVKSDQGDGSGRGISEVIHRKKNTERAGVAVRKVKGNRGVEEVNAISNSLEGWA